MQIIPQVGLFKMNEIIQPFDTSSFCNFNDILFAFYNYSFLFFWLRKSKVNNGLPAPVALSGDIGYSRTMVSPIAIANTMRLNTKDKSIVNLGLCYLCALSPFLQKSLWGAAGLWPRRCFPPSQLQLLFCLRGQLPSLEMCWCLSWTWAYSTARWHSHLHLKGDGGLWKW